MGGASLDVLCAGLSVDKSSLLPTAWYSGMEDVATLAEAALVRYRFFGNRLRNMATAEISNGLFRVEELADGGFGVKWAFDQRREPFVIEFANATTCALKDKWDPSRFSRSRLAGARRW